VSKNAFHLSKYPGYAYCQSVLDYKKTEKAILQMQNSLGSTNGHEKTNEFGLASNGKVKNAYDIVMTKF